ncbi:MAG TPA: methyltransferase domain-containing protein [Polyangiaceae bacterium]|jgi:2-polyprenyl-3-methyl-5-hydroxy-6-metoxy-1,4-benzoquinol methylase
MSASDFDEAYYRRYYEDTSTRVQDAKKVGQLARAVTELMDWYDAPLEAVLDVGAGAGLWRDWFAKNKPAVTYRSTEYSAYACEAYGHEQRDISKWRARERFDLIVCQGVLPYLDDEGASRAIENLGAMARGFLYLEAITKRDFEEICDQKKTDGAVHLRRASFYRERLAKHFVNVGCGLYYSLKGSLQFYELERA